MENYINLIGSILLMGAYLGFVKGNLITNKTFCLINAFGGLCVGISAFYVKLWPQVIMEIFFVTFSILGVVKPPVPKKLTP
jgi:type III secretory pathway component EscV